MFECKTNPVRLILDTTRRCNLHCWYCHSTSGPDYKGPELSGDDAAHLFAAAEELKIFDITLTGGETLLWRGLEQAMNASSALDYPALQLITNATVVTKQRLEWLHQSNVQRICVSLDGLEDVHTVNRGAGQYAATLRGIQELREAVDNMTVISVIDQTNYDRWPELTEALIRLGVKQHHLAPVCFAGEAMSAYKGLTPDQFVAVRARIDQLQAQLPAGFILRFNDILIHGMNQRTMSLQSFTEGFKGWHTVVRPTGAVNMSVRAWGRSWRNNEALGNIKQQSLVEIVHATAQERAQLVRNRFSLETERQRKFHLHAPNDLIAADMQAVQTVEAGELMSGDDGDSSGSEQLHGGIISQQWLDTPLCEDLVKLQQQILQEPSRYRLRQELDFDLLFDRVTFDVTVLNEQEKQVIRQSLPQHYTA